LKKKATHQESNEEQKKHPHITATTAHHIHTLKAAGEYKNVM
jgi:hypothetical protein